MIEYIRHGEEISVCRIWATMRIWKDEEDNESKKKGMRLYKGRLNESNVWEEEARWILIKEKEKECLNVTVFWSMDDGGSDRAIWYNLLVHNMLVRWFIRRDLVYMYK